MKIAIIRQRYTAFGGAERFTDRAMQALVSKGASVSVIARDWKGEAQYPVELCKPFYLGRTWRDAAFSRCACQKISDQGYDLVQSHERIACCDIYRAGDGVHAEWLLQRARVLSPLQRFATSVSCFHRQLLKAETALFSSPRLKAVICNSKLIQKEIMDRFGLPEEKLPVLYNGVDTQAFSPALREQHREKLRCELGVSDDVPVFLFVGSGYMRKGVAAAIAAINQLPEQAELWVIGKDRQQKKYIKQAEAGRQRVRFLGPQQDVKPFYGAADGLLLPTLYDPFPNVVLEAMACGLPVISSTKCGAVDIIKDGRNGFICDALDIPGLAQRMRQLLDSQAAARVGMAGRATVADWTLERVAEQTLGLYERLANECLR